MLVGDSAPVCEYRNGPDLLRGEIRAVLADPNR
jgi:hypothetical protein